MTWQSHIDRKWPSWDSQGSKQPGPGVHALGQHVPLPPTVERGSLPVPWKHERSFHHYSHVIGNSGTVSFKRSAPYAFKRVWSPKWSRETERQVHQHQAPGDWTRTTSTRRTTSCASVLSHTQYSWVGLHLDMVPGKAQAIQIMLVAILALEGPVPSELFLTH